MDYIKELFQDTAVVSNVISIVVLGILGVILTLIKNSIAHINTEKASIAEQNAISDRVDALADLIEKNAEMYKNAILNSNLTADSKLQAMKDFEAIIVTYNEYVGGKKREVVAKVQPAVSEVQAKSNELSEKIADAIADKGNDMLDKLRNQINTK